MLAHSATQQWGMIDFNWMDKRVVSHDQRGIQSPGMAETGTQASGLRTSATGVTVARAVFSALLQAYSPFRNTWGASTETVVPVELVNGLAVQAVASAVAPSFAELATLEANWDSYGADPITPEALASAQDLVRRVVQEYSWLSVGDLTPYVLPLADGGVQIEWSGPNGRLDVEIDGGQEVNYLLMLGTGDEETFDEHHGVAFDAVVKAAGRMLGAA